jgi:hypothetical protein
MKEKNTNSQKEISNPNHNPKVKKTNISYKLGVRVIVPVCFNPIGI